jgi:hypothetical protein
MSARFRLFAFTLVMLASACASWRPVYSPADAAGAERIRIQTSDGRTIMVDQPTSAEVADALKWASRVDVREVDHAARAVLAMSGFVGGVLLVGGFVYALQAGK